MATQDGGPVARVIEYGERLRTLTADTIQQARDRGRDGDLATSEAQVRALLQELASRRLEIDGMTSRYRADSQTERSTIHQRGRVVGRLMGRSSLGYAVRGEMERGRGNARARLAHQDADVSEEIGRLKVLHRDLVETVRRELGFIKDEQQNRR